MLTTWRLGPWRGCRRPTQAVFFYLIHTAPSLPPSSSPLAFVAENDGAKVRPTFAGTNWEGSSDEGPPPGWASSEAGVMGSGPKRLPFWRFALRLPVLKTGGVLVSTDGLKSRLRVEVDRLAS